MTLKRENTARGFGLLKSIDLYGAAYNVQESSLASERAIWLGIDDPNPLVMAVDARQLGVETDQTAGWVAYPLPGQVQLTTRMHLNQQMAAELIGVLQHFVDAGVLPE